MIEQQTSLPEGWDLKQIKDFAHTTSGGTPKRGNAAYYNGEIPWVKSGDLNDGILTEVDEFISELGLEKSSAKLFQPNTLLVAMYGATIGKVSLLSFKAATNQAVCGISLPKEYEPKYFFYFLFSIKKQLIEQGKGGAQPNINQQIIKGTCVPIPPPVQQKQIVAKIEELFSHIDAGIESLNIAKEKLKQYRQSVLKAAVTGELTKDWRQANQHKIEPANQLLQRILKERRQRWEQQQLAQFQAKGKPPKNDKWKEKYKEPFKLYSSPDLWKIYKAGELFDCIVPNRDKPKTFSGHIPWVTTPDIDEFNSRIVYKNDGLGLTNDEVDKYKAKLVPRGSVIMTCVGRLGVAAVVDKTVVINQQLHAFVPSEFYDSKLLAYVLQSQKNYMESVATATTVQYLNKENSNSIPVPIMSMTEQKEIVRIVEEKLTAADRLMTEIDTKLTQAQQQKQTILASAFKGGLI